MPEVQAGLGSLIDSFLKISFNWKGMLSDPEFRSALRTMSVLAAKYLDTPMQVDDPMIANLERQIEMALDQIKQTSPGHPLVVGAAMAPSPAEVVAATDHLRQIGEARGVSFSADVVAQVKRHPKVLDVLSHKTLDQQAKILANPEWLQKVIDWLVKYGPTIAQVLAAILIPLL